MIIENIKYEIKKHINKPDIIKIGYIKEYLQIVILKYLYETNYGKDLFFYGGTCLRFLFGLNRLSEDLDFVGEKFNKFEELGQDIQKYFAKNNIKLNYKLQKFRIILNFKEFLNNFGIMFQSSKDLYIKIEISDHFSFCKNYEIHLYPIFKYNNSLVIKSFDKKTLFSTKINAVLYRSWEKHIGKNKITIKGRDIYDLFWYLSNGFQLNLNCINGYNSIDELKTQLIYIISNIDFKEVVLDIQNFIEDFGILTFIENNGKQFLLDQIKNI